MILFCVSKLFAVANLLSDATPVSGGSSLARSFGGDDDSSSNYPGLGRKTNCNLVIIIARNYCQEVNEVRLRGHGGPLISS